jgi:hypothetical protein
MRFEICISVVRPIKKRNGDHGHKAASAAYLDMALNPAASVINGNLSLREWGHNAKPCKMRLR